MNKVNEMKKDKWMGIQEILYTSENMLKVRINDRNEISKMK